MNTDREAREEIRREVEQLKRGREASEGRERAKDSEAGRNPSPKRAKQSESAGAERVAGPTAAGSTAKLPAPAVSNRAVAEGSDDYSDLEGVPNTTLYVGNLSYRATESMIVKVFSPHGRIVREQFCYHSAGPNAGQPRGFCFVEYATITEAARACRALKGRKMFGRPLRVNFAVSQEGGRPMEYSGGVLRESSGGGGPGGEDEPVGGAAEGSGGAGATLALDKKVALLKMKIKEAQAKQRP